MTSLITSTLVAIRAAHHPDVDRVVFEFAGPLPRTHDVQAVAQVIADASGQPVPLVGDAFLQVRMSPAIGHDEGGGSTYGAPSVTFALPEVIQVVSSGDFEGVLSFGIGLARESGFQSFTLTDPNRLVIDVDAAFRTVTVIDQFLDEPNFNAGIEPYARAVTRPVIPPATARGALQRLFAGPTTAELAAGLRFVNSQATGFADLSISDFVARVRLTGGCASGGSTFTIANEIMPTLKQFPAIRWVKIYDPAGHTERPDGHVDSIPESLEP